MLLVGADRRWRWLIDPPTYYWFIYSQSFVKLLVGRAGLIGFTYFLGLFFILGGVIAFILAISGYSSPS